MGTDHRDHAVKIAAVLLAARSQAAAVMLRMRRSQLRRRSRKLRQILCWRRNLKQNSKQDLKQNLKQTG